MKRDYEFYISKAKKEQGLRYDNQLEIMMGYKGSMFSIIRKGRKHLSEEKMIELAELANIDPMIALIDLQVMKSEGKTQSIFKRMQSVVASMPLALAGLWCIIPDILYIM